MIRIHRPARVPAALRNRGRRKTEQLCVQFDADPQAYSSGRVRFRSPDSKTYGSDDVRDALKHCQHNKCCYSEAKFVRDSVHVEHFRPKAALGQRGSRQKQYPGYYWLVYAWSNLLLCKAGVNSAKGDHFPLLNENARAQNHHYDISLEEPLFVDPGSEDPRDHIRFHNEEPYAYRSSTRGELTIDRLLRHPDLDEDRRTHFQRLHRLKKVLEALRDNQDEEMREMATLIQAELDAAAKPEAEYSSMVQDLLDEKTTTA